MLPTTPGSTITFDLPDGDGEVRGILTLISGHIDESGVPHDMVWASADVESPDQESVVFAAELIERSSPQLFTETAVPAEPVDPGELNEVGTVIQMEDEWGVLQTYTFAPSFLYAGEPQDCFWTNSYSGHISGASVEEAAQAGLVRVLYVPLRR